jgi:two-component system LytT family response regulator
LPRANDQNAFMKIRALIIDDEPLARQRILMFLRDEPDVEVAGECVNGAEAIRQIEQQKPDLVFLDVQMPLVGGFEVLRALPADRWPLVIFVTAYNQHALEAFEVHALDYLLKPFKLVRFRQALQRARQHLEARDAPGQNERFREWLLAQKETSYPSRLTVKSGERTDFVEVKDVDCIEAAGNYAILHTGAKNHILRDTLANLEARLSPKRFLRVSRSAIVNLDRVKAVQPTTRGEHVVLLKNGKELTLTRGVREIRQRLEAL